MIEMGKHFFRIIRINNIIIGVLCCIISLIKINANNYSASLLSILIIILLMIFSNIINDIFDIKTDKINHPHRTLVIHPEWKPIFMIIALIAASVAILLSVYLNFNTFLIIVISIPMLFLYTPLFKKIPLIGNILVAFYLSLVFLFIEIALTNNVKIMIVPAIIAFSISLIREIIKDVEDLKGDKQSGIRTFAVCMGERQTIYFSCALIALFCMFCTYVVFYSQHFYSMIAMFLLVFMPLFYLIFFLIKSPVAESCSEASSLLKKITILGLIIIYII